jgi:hypothetical protein
MYCQWNATDRTEVSYAARCNCTTTEDSFYKDNEMITPYWQTYTYTNVESNQQHFIKNNENVHITTDKHFYN